MKLAIQFLVQHGPIVLFIAVLAEQAGLPVPCVPLLVAAGWLASLGRMNLLVMIGLSMLACLLADSSWYEVGRRRRNSILHKRMDKPLGTLDRIRLRLAALNRCGLGALLIAKFLPGPNLVSPWAGISGVTWIRFLLFDVVASAAWAGSYITAGYMFRSQWEKVTALGWRFGLAVLFALVCVFAAVALIQTLRHRWPLRRRRAPQVAV